MVESRKKTNVREALNGSLKPKSKHSDRLSGQKLFRTAVRLVIEFKDWIDADDYDLSMPIDDDVNVNVKRAQRKKLSEHDLSIKDRSNLLTKPYKRSVEQVSHIDRLLKELNAFKKFPDEIRALIAKDCNYQYVPAGRTIIKQDREAKILYCVLAGNLQIYRNIIEPLTEKVTEIDSGVLEPGDMFGEIALLHNVPRTATVVSKSNTDLLIITKKVFNKYLRNILLEEWDILSDALVNFNYFKGWSEETMRECCILSKIESFEQNQVLIGDGKGSVHYVYFLLSGKCRLIEHMLVRKSGKGDNAKYKLYEPSEANSQHFVSLKSSDLLTEDYLPNKRISYNGSVAFDQSSSEATDYMKNIANAENKNSTTIAMDKLSVITVTLQDVINQWHEITDVVEMLMKRPSVTSLTQFPEDVKTVFMQICIFYRGACFGLGENMRNRRIIALTKVKCLLIPRYWLKRNNRANIWERVKNYMNFVYPNNKQLLHKYVENRRWTKYKTEYAKKLLTSGKNVPNDTKNYDVPYSIRINAT